MEEKMDLRVVKTYKALTEAFIALVNEKPFEDVTVNELCDRALIRRATFYKHFADKYEFFAFMIRRLQEQIQIEATQTGDGIDLGESLSATISNIFAFLEKNGDMARILTRNALPTLYDILAEQIIADFTKRISTAQNADAMEAPPEMVATFFTGALMYTFRYWMLQKNRVPEEVFLQQVMSLFHGWI